MLNERLLSVLSTKENVNLSTLGFTIENVKKFQALIAPVEIAGERLGTLFMYKSDSSYEIDDIILSEYGTTVVGLEMMRSVNEETAEESRKNQLLIHCQHLNLMLLRVYLKNLMAMKERLSQVRLLIMSA